MDPYFLSYFLIAIFMVPAALLAIWGTYVGQRIRKQEIAAEMEIKQVDSDFENMMNGFFQNLSSTGDSNQRSQNLQAMLRWLKTKYVELDSVLQAETQRLEANSRLRKREPGLFENAQGRLAQQAELLPKIDQHMKLIANMLASEAIERFDRLQ